MMSLQSTLCRLYSTCFLGVVLGITAGLFALIYSTGCKIAEKKQRIFHRKQCFEVVIITGGGGGITSEYFPDNNGNDDQYGCSSMCMRHTKLFATMS